MSSDNIGLARLRDGTVLIRIGKPPKTELAVWRYGDQFGKRRRRSLQLAGLSVTGSLATIALITAEYWGGSLLAMGTIAALSGAGTFLNLAVSVGSGALGWRKQYQLRAAVHSEDGSAIRLTSTSVRAVAFVRGGREFDWKLRVPRHLMTPTGTIPRMLGINERAEFNNDRVYLHGDTAQRALAKLLPHLNSDGAGKRRIIEALAIIIDACSMQQLLQRASLAKRKHRSDYHMDDGLAPLCGMPASLRLALEMALHEDDERRAMAGELHDLERRWRDADVIAKIADQLILPPEIDVQLNELKQRQREG